MQFRSFGRKSRFAGPTAVTVKCFEDNALLKSTLAEQPDPMRQGAGGRRRRIVALGTRGRLIAGIAVQRGWAGLVISAVRDSVALDLLDLGIKALGTNPRRAARPAPVSSTVPSKSAVWITPGRGRAL